HDRARSPALYYAARFMDGLLVFVFAFFGVHTFLWFSRGHVKHVPPPPGPRPVPPPPGRRPGNTGEVRRG
ncbi:MAG: hypothetical protein ACM36C_14170, partial [Acidobacteriota bacterium]